ncbi:TonB-dependent receptor domain-containing protein [Autumnicola musiva]|uniref:TonB-dependent receptor n=1 Tax=Autumnicola musiva TaxID=3075589 RepID=A0ABU3D657_9FLAO|nr:TonB-dependent receptor [Zunongwangia sp. F117]MDT0676989.1 TonB-dependent receptor [Zunongwangia sp. F117]
MKFLKLSLLFILCGLVKTSFSQNLILFEGSIKTESRESVFAADVLIKNIETDKVIAYTTTDSLGNFGIEVLPGTYLMEVHHLAFESYSNSLRISKDITSKQIVLNPGEERLSEVIITARKPLLEKKLDRMVLNVGNRPAFAGSNSFELLKSAPGIYTSLGNRLKLMGKSGIRLMLNGRLQQLNEDEISNFLKTLPAEDIESIEIITTPPAKYEAEGNAGIINIITKKQSGKGWNGNLALTGYYGDYGRYLGQAGFQYQGELLKTTVSYSGGKVNSFEEIEQYNNSELPEGEQRYRSFNYEPRKRFYNVLRSQVDFQINNSSNMSFSTRTSINENNRPSINQTFLTNSENNTVSSFQTSTREEVKFTNYSADLYYEYKLDSLGKKISLSASSAGFGTQNDQNFKNLFNAEENNYKERLQSDFDNDTQIHAFKLDINLPYANILWETGTKYGHTRAKNNFLFESFENDEWLKDTNLSNDFQYQEYNAAIYVSVQKELSDRWEVKAGLRGEYTATEGFSPTLEQTTTFNYFKLFPTFYLQYGASKDYQLNFTYSRRINRPDYRDLNPFITYQSPLFSNQGNPLLRPEFTHSIEFNHIIDKKYIVTPFYNFTQSYYSEFPQNVPGSAETRYTFGNIGNNQNFGLQAVIPVKFNDKIQLQQTLLALYQYYNISYNSISENPHGFFWMYQFSFNVAFSENLQAEISGNYRSSTLQGFYQIESSADLDIGFSYSFWKKKARLYAGLSDILYTNRSKVAIQYPSQSLGFTRYNDTRLLKIGFNYTFGQKNLKENISFGSASEEEQRRN